jgi:5-(carboxyamino)imidazole ribonucleotide mutase
LAIGNAGAVNAALLAVAILSLADAELGERYRAFRQAQAESVRSQSLPPRE